MNTKGINFLTYFLLLVIAASATACSLGKTNAQTIALKSAQTTTNTAPSELAYQPPKRVSRDIIKKEEKLAKPKIK